MELERCEWWCFPKEATAMRFRTLCFCLALTFVTIAGPVMAQQSTAPIDAGQLYKRVSPTVVLIEAVDDKGQTTKLGSGFLVGIDGRILTNFHVIAHTKAATVRLATGDAYDDVEVLSVDKRKDIALIKIKAVELPVVTLGRSSSVQIGSTIYSIGNPLGLQNTFSQGLISGVRQFDGYQYFQISAAISPGSSGGPVIGTDGAVIGIAEGSFKGGQNLNLAVPIDYAKGMLGSNQGQPLAAFYEPEPKDEETATPTLSPSQSTELPENAKNNLAVFLVSKLGQWRSADAIGMLGKPLREYTTDGPQSGAQPMKKYEYGDPTNLWRGIRLTFDHTSDVLIAVATYPWNMTVAQMKVLWGENFNAFRIEKDALIMYAYVDRPLLITANDLGAVDSITTYVRGGLYPSGDLGAPLAAPIPSIQQTKAPVEESHSALDVNGLKTKLGVLTSEEAIREFGQPYRRYTMPGKKRSEDLDVCMFADRTGTVRRIMLTFSANSKRLESIALFPYSMKASDIFSQLGSSYKTELVQGGMTSYLYKNKPVLLFVRANGDVFSFNITRSSPAWRALSGEEARNDWTIAIREPTHAELEQSGASGTSPGIGFAKERNTQILLIERNLGVWTADDARREFGPAATQQSSGDRSKNTDMDVYTFQAAKSGLLIMSLSFYRASGKLVNAILSPAGMKREQLIGLIGSDYVEEKDSKGNRVYKYRDGLIAATLDGMDNVSQIFVSLEL